MTCKRVLPVLVLLGIVVFAYAQEKPGFGISADIAYFPVFYENDSSLYGTALDGSLAATIQFRKFALGLEISDSYSSFSPGDGGDINGAWNILRGSVNASFKLSDKFELGTGIGGSWYRSAFSSDVAGIMGASHGGFSLKLSAGIHAWEKMSIWQINKLDLFLPAASDVFPFYYGALRFEFRPFAPWLGMYAEVGGMTIFADNSPVVDISGGAFVFSAGIVIDLAFKKRKGAQPRTPDENRIIPATVSEKPKEVTEKPKETDSREIENLRAAKAGDVVSFTNILFYPDQAVILDESFPIIDQIADVLKERADISIELTGYANYLGDAEGELTLSIRRAESVGRYLISSSIDPSRITITGKGSSDAKGEAVLRENRKVEIKVIK